MTRRAMAAAYRSGRSLREISRASGLCHETVRKRLIEAGVRLRTRKHRASLSAVALAEHLYREGAHISAVASVLQVKPRSARGFLLTRGIYRPLPASPHGSRGRYARYGCRCRECKNGNTERMLVYLERRRARAHCRATVV